MTAEQIEQIAVTLYELDRQKGLRYQRWSTGAGKKRDTYRARAKEILTREKFSRAKGRLERKFWMRGQAILSADRLPQPLPSQTRH